MEQDWLVIGRVAAPHGIRGELKVRLYNGESNLLEQVQELALRQGEAEPVLWRVRGARPTPRGWLLRLAGLGDRTAAELWQGADVLVHPDALPEPDEDEFYYRDLVGLAVEDTHGKALGVVESLFDTGSNDVLVVRSGEREVLLPFIDDVIVEVDIQGGRLVVDPLEGLLEG